MLLSFFYSSLVNWVQFITIRVTENYVIILLLLSFIYLVSSCFGQIYKFDFIPFSPILLFNRGLRIICFSWPAIFSSILHAWYNFVSLVFKLCINQSVSIWSLRKVSCHFTKRWVWKTLPKSWTGWIRRTESSLKFQRKIFN